MTFRHTARELYSHRATRSLFLALAVVASVLAMTAGNASADSLTLTWNPVTWLGNSGYNIYYGTTSRIYTHKVTVGNTNQVTLYGLDANTTYFFSVTSMVGGTESQFSQEIIFNPSTIPPSLQLAASAEGRSSLRAAAPAGHTYDILASQDFALWQTIGTVTVPYGGSFTFTDPAAARFAARFYRLHETTYTAPGSLPGLQMLAIEGGKGRLQIAGQLGHSYDILASQDLSVWKAIATVTTASPGAITFTDPKAAQYPARFYLLHEVTYASQLPAYKLTAGPKGQIQLQITGLAGHTYEILATQNFIAWSVIGRVTIGLGSVAQFTDPAGAGLLRFYGVREATFP